MIVPGPAQDIYMKLLLDVARVSWTKGTRHLGRDPEQVFLGMSPGLSLPGSEEGGRARHRSELLVQQDWEATHNEEGRS